MYVRGEMREDRTAECSVRRELSTGGIPRLCWMMEADYFV